MCGGSESRQGEKKGRGDDYTERKKNNRNHDIISLKFVT